VGAVVGAVWVGWVFAAVFAAVAVLCAVRLLASRGDASGCGCSTDRSADASHGVMSLSMAVMFSPWGDPVPALYWQVIFSVAAAWFAVRLLGRKLGSATVQRPGTQGGTDLHHVLGSLAMVYMLAAVPAGHDMTHRDMPGMGSPGLVLPALAWAFIAYFLVYAMRLVARLVEPVNTVAANSTGAALAGGGPWGVVTSPHLIGAGLVIRGIGMSFMLVTML
jgi:hypothetical protein